MKKILSILMIALILQSAVLVCTLQFKAQASEEGDLEGPDYIQPPKHYKTSQMMLGEAGYLADPGPPPVPVTGTRQLLVIMVEFSNVAHDPTHTAAFYQDRFFDTTPPSVRDYFVNVSYGTFTYIPGSVVGWYVSTHPQSDWTNVDSRPIAAEAIQHADADVNFGSFDANNDGVVTNEELTIFLIVSGDLGGAFHWWTTSQVTTGDVNGIGNAVNVEGEFSASHEDRHIGGYCHELGHDLGLPDLYDTTPAPPSSPDSEGIGQFGLMGGGSWTFSHMDAWCKIQLGWITPTVVTHSGYYDVHDAETHAEAFVLIDTAHSSSEYFLVENRWPTNSFYETVGAPVAPDGTYPDQGIVIYHIDETKVQGWINSGTNNVNADEEHKGVDVECADHQTSHVVNADDLDQLVNRGDANDLWDSSAYDFSDTSTPCNASWYVNEKSGISVSKFPVASATMKVCFTLARKFAYVYCGWGMSTMQDEINYLHSLDPGKYSFDWYNENNIGNLWTKLNKYEAILVDEDTFYNALWTQLAGPIYDSFKSHASDLDAFVRNGGGLFTSCENDLLKTQAWDWLPTGMQVTSHDPETLSGVHIFFDPGTPNGLYSHPNTITDAYLSSRGDTHGWFESWDTGYIATINRTDNNKPVELYGVFEDSAHTNYGCVVVSHVEAETGNAWEYLQNELDFIIPAIKYKLTVLKPIEGEFFKWGDDVSFEAKITDDSGNPGTGASVTVNSPTGAPISLIETPTGSGIYKGTYTLLPTDPIGTWAISFVASIEGEFPKESVPVLIPEQTPPTITVVTPKETPAEALQDGVTFDATVSDPSGVDWVKFSIRETDGTTVDPSFESMLPVHMSGDTWQLLFNTYVPKLPDGNYLFIVNASDTYDNEGSKTVLFSIRNWASMDRLPFSTSNKAGRTVPIKFSLRVDETVDPTTPFVYNEQLTIKVYQKSDPGNILQTSTYGTGSKDYRIDSDQELYITNFKTLPRPMTYVVEIYRKDMLIGSFEFSTIK